MLCVPPWLATAGGTFRLRAKEPAQIIGQAQELLINQDRDQALDLLAKAISQGGRKSSTQELQAAFRKMEELFLTEQGQQAYEFANVLRIDQPQQAKEKYLESLKLEGENILVIGGLVRLLIATRECSQANHWVEKSKQRHAPSEKMGLLLVYASACDGDTEALSAVLNSDSGKLLPEGLHKAYSLEKEVLRGGSKPALLGSLRDEQLQPLLWRMQIYSPDKNVKKLALIERYLEFCRKRGREVLEDWYYDPRLCSDEEVVTKQKASEEQALMKAKAKP